LTPSAVALGVGAYRGDGGAVLDRDTRVPEEPRGSEKLAGLLQTQGYDLATSPEEADLVVANTCAFIEAAREESIETVLLLADRNNMAQGSWSRAAWPNATARTGGRTARSRPRRGIW